MPVPARPKIYHIVHVDRLASIVEEKRLWCDAEMMKRQNSGTTIGMSNIKARRLKELTLSSHPGLYVGQCTPFYFCSRSVMLYLMYAKSQELTYKGGQEPIIHLEADMIATIEWAEAKGRRWAFSRSNAGAYYFEDYCSLDDLDKINWEAVRAKQWAGNGVSRSVKEGKQAEFLIERSFPWHLVERIGVASRQIAAQVHQAYGITKHRPPVEIKTDWYY